ncbi:MAG TPA: hypothetical protein VIF88_08175 [Methylocystis sp.]
MLTDEEEIKLAEIFPKFLGRLETVKKTFESWCRAVDADDAKLAVCLGTQATNECSLLIQSVDDAKWWIADIGNYLPARVANSEFMAQRAARRAAAAADSEKIG